GVAMRHRSLRNRLVWMQQAHGLVAGDVILQKTPFSFDVSVWEFFWPLMNGARLAVAAPGDHRDPLRLIELIRRHAVTTIHFVPSMLQNFISCNNTQTCTTLRRILCSGEALSMELQHKTLRQLHWAKLFNLYGPTEAAIDVTQWACKNDAHGSVAIGQPISDTKTRILDTDLNLVPQGVAGELYLGGVGLARGYLNRRGLTTERFVADPFDEKGGRLYRTGDLARWRGDGQIEYLGRLDNQVKVRGFRIELGEIEAQLLLQREVREAVVVARRGTGGTRLVAYVSVHAGKSLDIPVLREALSKALPDYMIPAAIMVLDSLPLSPNGKVDRRMLPKPEFANIDHYEAPQGEMEEVVADIWADVLGIGQVGRNDNFFALGGHSLAILQVQQKLQQNLSVSLPLRSYFENPLLTDLVSVIQDQRSLRVMEHVEHAELMGMSELLDLLES
ncbi:AMP-binding protein, partial [Nitrosospira sp. NpAV]|uniref:AMP-binding protein n=1 Tax=Nitrosospira sp. NpAV TaxID=58133 RepID=UPI0012EB8FEF